MSELEEIAIEKFLNFYRADIESEVIDDRTIVLSFPVHFSGFHRIEVTITRAQPDRFIISDGAKVADELRLAGYSLNKRFRDRLEAITKFAGIRVVNSHLVGECTSSDFGSCLQRFVEAAKTIGDVYLVQPVVNKRDAYLIGQVSSYLIQQNVAFKTRHQLTGLYENHVADFYFPPNGVPGLALSVINSPNRTTAEAWAFRSLDIKNKNERTQVGVIYDDFGVKESSKSILKGVLDVSIPSSELPSLGRSLRSIGIVKPVPLVSV